MLSADPSYPVFKLAFNLHRPYSAFAPCVFPSNPLSRSGHRQGQLVTKREDRRLQGGTGSKTGGYQ
jgi:hypothetical protein